MATEARTERVEIRTTRQETAMMRELAEADGVTIADAIRMLVRRAHAERFGVQKKKR